jgi:Glycosyl hydrolase family 79 C-terminal beta domain
MRRRLTATANDVKQPKQRLNQMKACHWICAGCLLTGTAMAQSPITLTIDVQSPGQAIPAGYSGLSFGTISLKPGSDGYFFDSSSTQVVTLFQQMGIKYLRIGGTSVDTNNSNFTPTNQDVDALFRFVNAAGVKVIYSLRLMNGDPSQDASMADYIWNNYRQYLDCFAIGNEPDVYGNQDPQITNFSSYLAKWRSFASTITNSVPSAKFGGPDGGSSSKGNSWGTNFASNETDSGIVTSIHFHYYVGGSSANLTIQQIIDEVLSPGWVSTNYPAQYNSSCAPALSLGFPFRFTEANSYYTGGGAGIAGGNNCFATALFALDFMHWWALYNCEEVCFHTSMWKYNGVFYPDANGNYQVYPIGYGIKAFDLGGHGNVMPLVMTNSNGLNLTAYAVDDTTNFYVTIINKEHDAGARNAAVTIALNGFVSGSAAAMFLAAPNNDPSATNGITLGGVAITNSGSWLGQWTALDPLTNGQCVVTVPATSAAVIKIAMREILVITNLDNQLKLSWPYGILQNATNIFGPYNDMSNASSPYTVSTTNAQEFYRAREN